MTRHYVLNIRSTSKLISIRMLRLEAMTNYQPQNEIKADDSVAAAVTYEYSKSGDAFNLLKLILF